MDTGIEQSINFWPLGLYVLAVLVIVGIMLGLSYFLGSRHSDRAKNEIYESGIAVTGSARIRFSANFYLVAMFFVIFDLESVYLFAWATSVKELGWQGYFQVVFFVVMLIVALIYLWRSGGLKMEPPLRKIPDLTKGEK